MDRLPEVSAEALMDQAREAFEQMMREVAAAVNTAPEGRVIRDSEERVRDVLGDFRQKVYQKALQMRVDAAEAAFSPGEPADGTPAPGQGPRRPQPADGQRLGADST